MSAGGNETSESGGEDIQLWHAELSDREHGDGAPCQGLAGWGLCWTLPV